MHGEIVNTRVRIVPGHDTRQRFSRLAWAGLNRKGMPGLEAVRPGLPILYNRNSYGSPFIADRKRSMSKEAQAVQQDTEIWVEDRLYRAGMALKLPRYVCSRRNRPVKPRTPDGLSFEDTRDDEEKVLGLARLVQIAAGSPNEFYMRDHDPLIRCAALLELVDVPQHTA